MKIKEACDILNIDINKLKDSTFKVEDIKSYYRAAILKSHPDKGGSVEQAYMVNEANEYLKNNFDKIKDMLSCNSTQGTGFVDFNFVYRKNSNTSKNVKHINIKDSEINSNTFKDDNGNEISLSELYNYIITLQVYIIIYENNVLRRINDEWCIGRFNTEYMYDVELEIKKYSAASIRLLGRELDVSNFNDSVNYRNIRLNIKSRIGNFRIKVKVHYVW